MIVLYVGEENNCKRYAYHTINKYQLEKNIFYNANKEFSQWELYNLIFESREGKSFHFFTDDLINANVYILDYIQKLFHIVRYKFLTIAYQKYTDNGISRHTPINHYKNIFYDCSLCWKKRNG